MTIAIKKRGGRGNLDNFFSLSLPNFKKKWGHMRK